MNLKGQAHDLIKNINGRLGSSAYDTAWMARVPADGGGGPRWPELLDWLIKHQQADGSWGGQIAYYHDRIICTLAAIVALKEYGIDKTAQQAIERGERYIWHNLDRLHSDPFELVGFELILPTLLIEALELGLKIPQHTCGYSHIRQKKLELIPPDLLYSPRVTIVHSLEFLGKEGDPDRLGQALAVNGSLGNSPAATSYYLIRGGTDQRALTYLEDVLDRYKHAVSLYPCHIYLLTWTLHSLGFCEQPLSNFVDVSIWEEIRANLSEKGIGLDPTFGIEDCDITSVTIRLLTLAGYSVDPNILSRFANPEKFIFRTYDYERNPSIGTNIHALEAIHVLPEYPDRDKYRKQILDFLMDNRVFNTYWIDKWHASPYYATAHVLVGICRTAPEPIDECECQSTVEWIIHTQREDGSWGFFDRGTVEETAYAMITLLHYHRHCSTLANLDVLKKGAHFLEKMSEEGKQDALYPRLYIEKCLYTPQDVVHATVLAARILYHETFGESL
ncbi:MAG: hypothetical protein JXM69_15935 [Anaerolineae bacterium]|nr:hypothetical protein [Anaerolineae bacterium]